MVVERRQRVKGSDIKAYLDAKGITQTFVSERTGISPPKLNMMLHDKRGIDVNEYMRICDALEVPLEHFR